MIWYAVFNVAVLVFTFDEGCYLQYLKANVLFRKRYKFTKSYNAFPGGTQIIQSANTVNHRTFYFEIFILVSVQAGPNTAQIGACNRRQDRRIKTIKNRSICVSFG